MLLVLCGFSTVVPLVFVRMTQFETCLLLLPPALRRTALCLWRTHLKAQVGVGIAMKVCAACALP